MLLPERSPSPRAARPAPHGPPRPAPHRAAGARRPPSRVAAAVPPLSAGAAVPAPARLRPAAKRPLADTHRGAAAPAHPASARDAQARREPASRSRGRHGPCGAGTPGWLVAGSLLALEPCPSCPVYGAFHRERSAELRFVQSTSYNSVV